MTFVDRIVRFPECLNLTGLSRATIYRKMKRGTFPSNHSLGPNCTGWRFSEILAWIANPR